MRQLSDLFQTLKQSEKTSTLNLFPAKEESTVTTRTWRMIAKFSTCATLSRIQMVREKCSTGVSSVPIRQFSIRAPWSAPFPWTVWIARMLQVCMRDQTLSTQNLAWWRNRGRRGTTRTTTGKEGTMRRARETMRRARGTMKTTQTMTTSRHLREISYRLITNLNG